MRSGTSYAAPQVAAVASIIKDVTDLPVSEIRRAILDAASDYGDLDQYGQGLFNGFGAVALALKRAKELGYNNEITVVGDINLGTGDPIPGSELTISDDTRINEEIYVLPGSTLRLRGSVTLDDTRIYVLGTLDEQASLVRLINDGEIFCRPSSTGGRCDFQGNKIVMENGGCIMVDRGAEAIIDVPVTVKNGGFLVNRGGTITLEDGARLDVQSDAAPPQIAPGSTFKMGRNALVYFHREVDLKGTADAPIRFEPSGNPTSSTDQWEFVLVRGDNSSFRHVDFKGGRWTLRVEAKNVLIEDASFTDNHSNNSITTGPAFSGGRSSLSVFTSTFSGRNQGISVNSGDVYLYGNAFTDIPGSAVSAYLGSVKAMAGNYISGTTTVQTYEGAVYARDGSEVYLGSYPHGYDGRNTIRENGGREVSTTGSGRLYAGIEDCNNPYDPGNCAVFGGRNNIYDTDGQTSHYHAYVYEGGTYSVYAKYNYWGTSSAPPSYRFYGSVYRTPHLSSFVSGAPTAPRVEVAPTELVAQEATLQARAASENRLATTPGLSLDGRPADAAASVASPETAQARATSRTQIIAAQQALTAAADRAEGAARAAELYYLHRGLVSGTEAEGKALPAEDALVAADTRTLLTSLADGPAAHPAVAERAALTLIDEALQEGDPQAAEARIKRYAGQVKSLEGRLELAHARVGSAVFGRRTAEALAALEAARALDAEWGTPNEELAFYDDFAEELRTFGDGAATADVHSASLASPETATKAGAETSVPAAYGLEAAYPNPFNPQATIRFALPEAADVRLVVYDVMGREVARLAEGAFDAGRHEATFDGSRLASGLYLYRLTAAGTAERFAKTGRMMLVK